MMLINLQIDEELVRNQLIINQAVEQTVLIKDLQEAQAFMFRDERTPQPNVKQTICFAAKAGSGLRMAFTAGGGGTTSPVKKWEGRPRMQTDHEAQVR
jgi:hypothetical protein